MEKISKGIFEDASETVLEIGCGNGKLLETLKANDKIKKWIGIERSKVSVKLCKKKISTLNLPFETEVIQDDNMKNIANESINCVLIRHVLCSVPLEGIKEIIKDCERILKPNGKIIVMEHVKWRNNCCCSNLQACMSPIQQFFGDGCEPNKDTMAILVEFENIFDVSDLKYKVLRTKWKCSPINSHIHGTMIKL